MNPLAFAASAILLVGAPLITCAQQPARVVRIGVLSNLLTPDSARFKVFREELRNLGYVEGKNLRFDYRRAGDESGRLAELAIELVTARVDLIVANGNQPAHAAKRATTTIPIVMPWSIDPIENGLVVSLARPGGNVTGLSYDVGDEFLAKGVEIFKESVPRMSSIAVLWESTYPGFDARARRIISASKTVDMTPYSVEVRTADDLTSAFEKIRKLRPSAIYNLSGPMLGSRRQDICDFALEEHLPTLSVVGEFTDAGCFMSYVVNLDDLYRRAAGYVDKILRGAKPGDLPVEQPTKFQLLINLRTAKALGLTIPQSILLRADRVIE